MAKEGLSGFEFLSVSTITTDYIQIQLEMSQKKTPSNSLGTYRMIIFVDY